MPNQTEVQEESDSKTYLFKPTKQLEIFTLDLIQQFRSKYFTMAAIDKFRETLLPTVDSHLLTDSALFSQWGKCGEPKAQQTGDRS